MSEFERDFSRQRGFFDPADMNGKSITIIGAGAIGSHVALLLAQMGIGAPGCGTIKVWDFDTVEAHNLQNQAYYKRHIGMPKVEALKELLFDRFEIEIEAHNEKVTDQDDVQSDYVFFMVDTMKSRREIMESAMAYCVNTKLIIEVRMDVDCGRVYAFNPSLPAEKEAWYGTLYTDEEAVQVSACGTVLSVVNTAMYTSNVALSKFIHHYKYNESSIVAHKKLAEEYPANKKVYFSNEFTLYPESMSIRKTHDSKIQRLY